MILSRAPSRRAFDTALAFDVACGHGRTNISFEDQLDAQWLQADSADCAQGCFTAPLTGRLAGFNVLIADIGLLKYSDNVKIQTKLIVKKFVVLPSKATYLNLVFQTIGYDEGQAPGVSESSKIDMFPSLVADVPQRSKPTGSSTINLESFHIQQALRMYSSIPALRMLVVHQLSNHHRRLDHHRGTCSDYIVHQSKSRLFSIALFLATRK
ncbi:hypothetical protein IWX91DRAFT_320247 [Phyllosticta citricarpa]